MQTLEMAGNSSIPFPANFFCAILQVSPHVGVANAVNLFTSDLTEEQKKQVKKSIADNQNRLKEFERRERLHKVRGKKKNLINLFY
jgi:hypothetical protein